METNQPFDISVVVPVYNESESIPLLLDRLVPVLDRLGRWQLIMVNDGSTDGSGEVLNRIHRDSPERVTVIHLRTNRGKATALSAGFKEAKGRLVAMMDADLQDHPEELPKLVEHLEQNQLDVVTGWKINRQDPVTKTIPSLFFNKVLHLFFNLKIHDHNCGLKLMRCECLHGLELYGQLHRFLLILLADRGFRIGEVGVNHSPRRYGRTKYGIMRIFQGAMDFMTVVFITRYVESPMYFFGFYGLLCLIGAVFISGLIFTGWIAADNPIGYLDRHPIWLLAPICLMACILFWGLGLLGELVYHLSNWRRKQDWVANRLPPTQPYRGDEKN